MTSAGLAEISAYIRIMSYATSQLWTMLLSVIDRIDVKVILVIFVKW